MAETDSEASGDWAGGCPALFLCGTCRMPLAESEDLMRGPEGEKSILLKAVTENVKIDENKAVSSYKRDSFSTVQILHCKGCSSAIGALYVATPILLDYKRDLFHFNTSAVTCYYFNNPQKQRSRMDQRFGKLTTISYMEKQLKKCRTVFGFCERAVTEIEKQLDSTGSL